MTMEGRRSPRKAMQDWLTDVRQRHNTAQWTIDGKNGGMPYDEPCLPDLGSARPFRSHGKEHRHGSQRSRTREDMLENLRGTKQKEGDRLNRVQKDKNLAEYLDLAPAFRKMATSKNSARGRKRERSSSRSSYLEPATLPIVVTPQPKATRRSQTSHLCLENPVPRRHHKASSPADQTSSSSSRELVEQPSRTYEKRSRRKTKEDRYKLKQAPEHTRPPKEIAKKPKRRPRKARTGSSLLHNFSARNVASKRLTLQPGVKLGLFTKGFASLPVKRGGLPDLAFSEKVFLNAPNQSVSEQKHVSDTKKQMKDRRTLCVDDDEYSRFFAAVGAHPSLKESHNPIYCVDTSSPRSKHQFQTARHQVAKGVSPVPSTKITERPFLGWGSHGPHLTSSMKPDHMGRTSISPTKVPLPTSPSFPTSYMTWSTSPKRSHDSPSMRPAHESFHSSPVKVRKPVIRSVSASKHHHDRRLSHPSAFQEPIQETSAVAITNNFREVAEPISRSESVDLGHVEVFDLNRAGRPQIMDDNTICAIDERDSVPQSQSQSRSDESRTGKDTHPSQLPDELDQRDPQIVGGGRNMSIHFTDALQEFLKQWKDGSIVPTSNANLPSRPSINDSQNVTEVLNEAVPLCEDSSKEAATQSLLHTEDNIFSKAIAVTSPIPFLKRPKSSTSVPFNTTVSPSLQTLTTRHQLSSVRPPLGEVGQYGSWTKSPFQDSAYDTCNGADSIYARQMCDTVIGFQHAYTPDPSIELQAQMDEPEGAYSYRTIQHAGISPSILNHEHGSIASAFENSYWCHPPESNHDWSSEMTVPRSRAGLDPRVLQGLSSDLWVSPTAQRKAATEPNRHEHQVSLSLTQGDPELQPRKEPSQREIFRELRRDATLLAAHGLCYSATRESQAAKSSSNLSADISPIGFWKPNMLY